MSGEQGKPGTPFSFPCSALLQASPPVFHYQLPFQLKFMTREALGSEFCLPRRVTWVPMKPASLQGGMLSGRWGLGQGSLCPGAVPRPSPQSQRL